ncbi:MAG TPA: hypothetical protein VIG24_07595 [Acidimicrobiia bacterium]
MATTTDTYDRLTEEERRAIIAYVANVGRSLHDADEWSMDDNYSTTEGVYDLYLDHIRAHHANESGTVRLAFLATLLLAVVPVSLVALFLASLAGGIAGVVA